MPRFVCFAKHSKPRYFFLAFQVPIADVEKSSFFLNDMIRVKGLECITFTKVTVLNHDVFPRPETPTTRKQDLKLQRKKPKKTRLLWQWKALLVPGSDAHFAATSKSGRECCVHCGPGGRTREMAWFNTGYHVLVTF